jgi:hypothetical protein
MRQLTTRISDEGDLLMASTVMVRANYAGTRKNPTIGLKSSG